MEYIGGKERYDRLLKGLALGMTRRRACDYAGLSVDALALVMSAEYPSAEVSALIDTIRRAEVHSLVFDATALATLTPSALRERLLALEQGEEPGPDLD
ncbi:MAG: hypothetical protein HOP09_14565 [Hyphomicrobium sp.]|nr:hypothetical protein [Hyphomicrobium sp.]